jgi:tyrosine decarboxylase/aspartate 1-decarboxylase
LHLGEISLECSRPGAAAAALWATQQLLPLQRGGDFAQGLERGRKAALALYAKLKADDRFVTAFQPELDIAVFAPRASSLTRMSALSRKIFAAAAEQGLHLAIADLQVALFPNHDPGTEKDRPKLTVLRSVLMKPEHLDWIDRIWHLLILAAQQVATQP